MTTPAAVLKASAFCSVKQIPEREAVTYKAKRKCYKKPAIHSRTESAVRLDVRIVTDPSFPYNQDQLNEAWKIYLLVYDELKNLDHEKFIVLHLNSQLVLNCIQVFPGTIDHAPHYTREIIKASLLSASNNIALVHNHPSGNLEFSQDDRITTYKMRAAASLMDIKLIDHILIAGPYYKSFVEEEKK